VEHDCMGSPCRPGTPTSSDSPLSPLRSCWPAVATRCHCAGAVRKQRGGGHVLRPLEERLWDRSRWLVGSKRRPGGHRALRGRRIVHLRRYRQRCTFRATPVHHWMRTSPSFVAGILVHGRRGPSEGRCVVAFLNATVWNAPSTPGGNQGDVGTGGRSGLDARRDAALRDRHLRGRSGRALDHRGEQRS
jgi:hypothetical protein